MKKKVICTLALISIFVGILLVKVLATNEYEMDATVNKSLIRRGDQFDVTISVKNVSDGIVGTNITLSIDSTKLELVGSLQTLNGWDVVEADVTYFLLSPNQEVVTTQQQICKLTFKVKDDAALGNTVISFNNIEIADDEYNLEAIADENVTININQKDLNIDTAYSTTELTNQNVQVTLSSTDELQSISGWTKSSDGKSLTKSYSSNTTENVLVKDIIGNEKNVTITINNIDKTAPTANVDYSTQNPTKENVTVTITASEEIQNVSGWTKSNDGKTITKTYSQNKTETITIKDLAGNTKAVNVEINNIDKTSPTTNIAYSSQDPTTGVVTVTITANEEIQDVAGWTKLEGGITITKEYSQNTNESVTVEDLAGNQTIVSVVIDNIWKKGDLNDNNQIDIGDILLIYRHIAQKNSAETAQKHPEWKLSDQKVLQGDLNNNNQLDIGDALKIQRYISAKNSSTVANKHPDWLVFD